jgi:nitroreductase
MDFFDVVDRRASYREEFDGTDISKEDLEEIVEAGIKAPSGYNHQTTSFVIVSNPEIKSKLAEFVPTKAMKTAAAVIIPVSSYWEAENGLSFEIEDYAASVENIMLAIAAKGYAGVWVDGQMKLNHTGDKIAELIHLEKGFTVRAVIPVGRPVKDVRQKEKMSFRERARFIE